MQLLTPSGYKDIADCAVGDAVSAFDMVTGAPITNTIEGINPLPWADADDYRTRSDNPDAPYGSFLINGTWTLFQDQSLWFKPAGWAALANPINVTHASLLQIGDTIFDDTDSDVEIASIVPITAAPFIRLRISGDHSYIADGITLHNATRYWVGSGATTNINATGNTNWSATDGGSNNASVPGSTDDVFFTSLSGSGTATLNVNTSWQSFDCTGTTITWSHSNAVTLTIAGNGVTAKLAPGMTYVPASSSRILAFTGTSGTTLFTSASKVMGGVTINGVGGTVQLQDNLSVNATQASSLLTVTTGTLDANGKTITTSRLISNSGSVRAVTAGGDITLNGTGTILDFSTPANLSFTKGSANIIVPANVASTRTVDGGGKTFNTITIGPNTTSGALTITSSNTIDTLAITGPNNIRLTNGSTQTLGAALSLTSSPSAPISIGSTASGSPATLSKSSGTVTNSDCAISDITFAGGATWIFNETFDFGGNSGAAINVPGGSGGGGMLYMPGLDGLG